MSNSRGLWSGFARGVFVVAALLASGTFASIASAAPGETDEARVREAVTHFFVGGTGSIAGQQTVVGNCRSYRVKAGETFLDIARAEDLGYNELVAANPDVDPWVPPAGAELVLPTEWVLPRGDYEGIVLNIPEMRLYYYVPSPRSGGKSSMVVTYPVGLGRKDWQTPQGKFRVRGKTRNPAWVIPESIKQERFREEGKTEDVIPGGHPDNPLGKYRLDLTIPSYAIHGTNKDWGVGMEVSHGCVRMYPEDIEGLFPLVPIGTPGRFAYQPVKVGLRRGRVVVEVHPDIYGVSPWPWMLAQQVVKDAGVQRYVDGKRLEAAVAVASGIPTDVSYADWPVAEVPDPIKFDPRGNPEEPYPQAEKQSRAQR